jgi:hypothetical protein
MSEEQKSGLQKIINDYNEMKNKLIKLSQVLKLEKKSKEDYAEKNQVLETKNHSLEEENNTLHVNYDNIKKRYDQLQKELSETKENAKKNNFSMFSYFTSSNIKEENKIMLERIKILENELEIKIKENEDCHVEVFDIKQQCNKMIEELEEKVSKNEKELKNSIEEGKNLKDKNITLQNLKDIAENNIIKKDEEINTLTRLYTNQKFEYEIMEKQLTSKLNEKEKVEKIISNINEYFNFSNLIYEFDFLKHFKIKNKLFQRQKLFLKKILEITQILISENIEYLIEYFKDRFNFYILLTNDKKTTFIIEKIISYLILLQQYLRTLNIFIGLIIFLFENEKNEDINLQKLILYKNISLVFIFKSFELFKLIFKYIIELSKYFEEIPYIDSKYIYDLMSILNLFIKKLFICFNFNKIYNLKNINILTDRTFHVSIKISKTYFENYKNINFTNYDPKLLLKLFNKDIPTIKNIYEDFLSKFSISNEKEFSFLEKNQIIIEKNKIDEIRKNGEFITKYLNGINNCIDLMMNYQNEIEEILLYKNTILNKEILLIIFNPYIFSKIIPEKKIERNIKEISYKESLENREKLNKLMESKNLIKDEQNKISKKFLEYEAKIKELQNNLNNQQNENDLLRMKLMNNSFIHETIKEENQTKNNNEINEFLSNQNSILNNENKEFKSLKEEIKNYNNIEYHRKVNDIIKRYSLKIKNIDMKIEINAQKEEIKNDYEKKITNLKNELQIKENKFNEIINEKNDAIEGFSQQISYLSESLGEFETLKSIICSKCQETFDKNKN